MIGPLVSTAWLHAHLQDSDLLIADVRWYIEDQDGGCHAFEQGRIPGAIFFDLDRELSDQSDPKRGRHPLPDPNTFTKTLRRKGINPETKLVVYDDRGGSIAVRLWWMMRWLGCENAALLDGGIPRWIQNGYPIETGQPRSPKPANLNLESVQHTERIAGLHDVESLGKTRAVLADARAPERYRGDVEPIDLRAGHIPGAINLPWTENLTDEAAPIFRSADELRARFARHGIHSDSDIICYCGSGVTACHNILALELSGITRVRLYPGSWSEWIQHHS